MARSLFHFIRDAEKVGMPVGMIKFVHENYGISWTKQGSYTDTTDNTLYLNKTHRDHLAKNAQLGGRESEKGKFYRESDRESVKELYHEASHAYLDLKRGADGFRNRFAKIEKATMSKEIKSAFEKATKYYRDKPLSKGGEVTSPEDVTDEAIAMYVAHRASWFWDTLDKLVFYDGFIDHTPAKTASVLNLLWKTIGDYDAAMKERVFGYQQIFDQQARVDAKIPTSLKTMCDEWLENKVPDNFYGSTTLNRYSLQIVTKAMHVAPAETAKK